ncbi:hypothetical protein EXIGLDRAFT_721992 [Exidia glandulosa HHB12029]|uniref:Protein kinase domain-containing protein n=1 Tax=Exidia glandulosa HHB12029 TaxID=1314781 RepID=A0A165FJY0_EXIGL|nr:hypothetical protein EXIGLDRAFT_721992 [Exidia glandulosa HHB12029]
MPATQISSGRQVMLKIVCTRPEYLGGEELDILQFLNDPALRSHPDNPAVELLDVLDLPTLPRGEQLASCFKIIVMPFLREVGFSICGDTRTVLDLMRQSFTAIAFLHSHGICHRDIGRGNFMLSGDTPSCRLHVIDFGQSFRLPISGRALVQSIRGPWIGGQIQVHPESEYERGTLHDPFMAEVYALARMWELLFVKCPYPVQMLINRMKNRNPDARPTLAAALQGLDDAIDVLPPHVLREPQQYVRMAASNRGSQSWSTIWSAGVYYPYLVFFSFCCFLLFSPSWSSAVTRVS